MDPPSGKPSRGAQAVVGSLFEAWREGGVNMVKLPGGSPLWAMLEAAKRSFVYVNLWSRRPAHAYDLAAGIMLVRGAGGDVIDLAGKPIETTDHRGLSLPKILSGSDSVRLGGL